MTDDIEQARKRLEQMAVSCERSAERGDVFDPNPQLAAMAVASSNTAKAIRALLADHSRLLERVGELEAAARDPMGGEGLASRNTGYHLCADAGACPHSHLVMPMPVPTPLGDPRYGAYLDLRDLVKVAYRHSRDNPSMERLKRFIEYNYSDYLATCDGIDLMSPEAIEALRAPNTQASASGKAEGGDA